MEFRIREGVIDDLESIMELIRDFAEFQNSTPMMQNSIERMRSEQDNFDFWVAENAKGEIIGYLAFFIVTIPGLVSLYISMIFIFDQQIREEVLVK